MPPKNPHFYPLRGTAVNSLKKCLEHFLIIEKKSPVILVGVAFHLWLQSLKFFLNLL